MYRLEVYKGLSHRKSYKKARTKQLNSLNSLRVLCLDIEYDGILRTLGFEPEDWRKHCHTGKLESPKERTIMVSVRALYQVFGRGCRGLDNHATSRIWG